jgi:hypothetical protein
VKGGPLVQVYVLSGIAAGLLVLLVLSKLYQCCCAKRRPADDLRQPLLVNVE